VKYGRRQSGGRGAKLNTKFKPYTHTTHAHAHTHPTPGTWTDRGIVKRGDLVLNEAGMMTHTLVGLANDKPTKIGKSMRSINEVTEGGCQSGKGGWLFFKGGGGQSSKEGWLSMWSIK
jgi:hypothetical protein